MISHRRKCRLFERKLPAVIPNLESIQVSNTFPTMINITEAVRINANRKVRNIDLILLCQSDQVSKVDGYAFSNPLTIAITPFEEKNTASKKDRDNTFFWGLVVKSAMKRYKASPALPGNKSAIEFWMVSLKLEYTGRKGNRVNNKINKGNKERKKLKAIELALVTKSICLDSWYRNIVRSYMETPNAPGIEVVLVHDSIPDFSKPENKRFLILFHISILQQ